MHLWVSRHGSSREIMADWAVHSEFKRMNPFASWGGVGGGVNPFWHKQWSINQNSKFRHTECDRERNRQKGDGLPPLILWVSQHTTRSLISHNTTLYYSTVDEDCSLACTSCSNVNAANVKESDLDSLWAVFVIYSLQFPNVKVAHSLQTLELCLDLSFFL